MDVPAVSRPERLLLAAVVAASLASTALAVFLTRTAWFRVHDGAWHLRAVKASGVLLPVAVLLFALGVEWAIRKRPALALAALVPLPAWIASLHLTRMEAPAGATEAVLTNANLLVNDFWLALVMLQMQGIQPFGGA